MPVRMRPSHHPASTSVVVGDAVGERKRNVETCELLAIEDPEELKRALAMRGLDERNVSVKVVLRGGKNRSVVFWFDADRPSSSAARLGVVAAALRADGERVKLVLDQVSPENRMRAAVAVAKASYVFAPRRPSRPPFQIEISGGGAQLSGFGRVAEMTAWAADLENAASNLIGPPELAKAIVARCCPPGCRARVMGADEIARRGFGLLTGVGRGGEKPPCAVVLTTPRRRGRPLLALVGKGVTYDSGGLAIKPAQSMHGQHGDKSGAIVAAAVFRLHAERGEACPFDLVAVLPIAENLISAKSVRPGDVLTAFDGTTVEVVNPDAEGRLVLADAIAYVCKTHKPDALIDFATLTHTAESVHPDASAVVFAESDEVAGACERAGETCGERVWRLPKWTEYDHETGSAVADARNSGWATRADGYMAALFIRRFVSPAALRARWIHVDFGKNEATGTSPSSGSGPFVGTGVALGALLATSLFTS